LYYLLHSIQRSTVHSQKHILKHPLGSSIFWSLLRKFVYVSCLEKTKLTDYSEYNEARGSEKDFPLLLHNVLLRVQPLLCNRRINNGVMQPVSKERIGKHIPAATNTHTTIEEYISKQPIGNHTTKGVERCFLFGPWKMVITTSSVEKS
jgi:hypothetical protein